MRLRNGKKVESSVKATQIPMEEDSAESEDPYSTESTKSGDSNKAQWGSRSTSRSPIQAAESLLPGAGPSGSSYQPQFAPGQNLLHYGPVDPAGAPLYVNPPYPPFADEGLLPVQGHSDNIPPVPPQDHYSTVFPQENQEQQHYTPQPYNQTHHRQPSSHPQPPQLQTSHQHNNSIERFEADIPPWSPQGNPSHMHHQHHIPSIPGMDNSPPYRPPYDDKIETDLKRMEQEHGYVRDNQEAGPENEKERKGKSRSGKRKATSPPTLHSHKHHRKDRRDSDGGNGNGSRRSHATRAEMP